MHLISVGILILHFSACSTEYQKPSYGHVRFSLGDTIKLSDSISLAISKDRDGFKIESIRKSKPGFCEFILYEDGSLKSLQNIKGENQKKIGDGDWVTLYNIQSIKLDTNGFVNQYFLSRDFIEVAKGNYYDSLQGLKPSNFD